MDALDPNTPVLVGVGQVGDPTDGPNYRAWSPVDLAAAAAELALADAGGTGAAGAIDVVAGIRQFEISFPGAPAPLGRADNFPRAVAHRIGADPAHAVLDVVGGQAPQSLVAELANGIAAGSARAGLVVGAEAISTVAQRATAPDRPDWTETVGGQVEDRGLGLSGIVTKDLMRHGLLDAMTAYDLMENARRHRLGLDRDAYVQDMAELFAPFTAVAARNPLAAVRSERTADELRAVSGRNRMVTDLYPISMVARDKVNLGAAVLLMSVGEARDRRIPSERWVFLAGHAALREQNLLERPDLSCSPVAARCVTHALDVAGIGIDDVGFLDLYSCFPVAVSAIADPFGLCANDPRGLTVTGGLPFFGGPGNAYSLHAIAEVVARLREHPEAYGLIWANGGIFSKHAAGVYTGRPTSWRADASTAIQGEIAAAPKVPSTEQPAGDATVETFAISRAPGRDLAVVVGRQSDGVRFLANPSDPDTMALFEGEDAFGAKVRVTATATGNDVTVRS